MNRGVYRASQVPDIFSLYVPRSITPANSPHLAKIGASVMASTTLSVSPFALFA
jgi:hypothetical protein